MAFSAAGRTGPLAEINVTPLIDVMLVLLIIFIVTAPMVTRPIPLQLPQPTTRPLDRPEPPPPIALHLDAANGVRWNGSSITMAELLPRLQAQAAEHAGNHPELRISTDANAQYDGLVKILAVAEASGMQKIAFEE